LEKITENADYNSVPRLEEQLQILKVRENNFVAVFN
jgi:hypothetical protein